MKRDRVFIEPKGMTQDFEFNDDVVDVFDDMVSRSVPFYSEQQRMINEIANVFAVNGTNIYDLGSATGTTLINLCKDTDPSIKLIGYDNSESMIERSKQKIAQQGLEDRIEIRYGDLNGDIDALELTDASMVLMCWTLQFIRPLKRDGLIKKIYDSLGKGGVLLITEKILTNNSLQNRYFIRFYYDYKKRNGYSHEEIVNKREALENILVPYRVEENFEMLRRNGFEAVDTFFQWYNFAGFICIKNPS